MTAVNVKMTTPEKTNGGIVPSDLSQDEIDSVRSEVLSALRAKPPRIGLVGVSGVGKSSTINALFRTSLAISHTKACTKELLETEVNFHAGGTEMSGARVQLQIVDAPGLGESLATDPAYLEMYEKHLPTCDVILWVMAARSRSMVLDQMYLQRFKHLSSKIVFGVNQVDNVHPVDWISSANIPSVAMEESLSEIIIDRTEKVSEVLDTPISIVGYSANTGYRLERLFKQLISALPADRKWIFSGMKAFSYKDFYPDVKPKHKEVTVWQSLQTQIEHVSSSFLKKKRKTNSKR